MPPSAVVSRLSTSEVVRVLIPLKCPSYKHLYSGDAKMNVAMDAYEMLKGSSRETIFAAVLAAYAVYLVGLAFQRLYLSPIAKFPGPKLAALTRWYEFYYDVVLRGKFNDHITELHKIYGELVRLQHHVQLAKLT